MKKRLTPRFNVRTKMLCVFLASLIIPMSVFGFIMFYTGNSELEKEASETYTQMTRQISIVFSEYIARIDQTARLSENSSAIPRYLRNEVTGLETEPRKLIELETAALGQLEQLWRAGGDIYSVTAAAFNGKTLSFADGKADRLLSPIDGGYYEPLRSSTGNTVLLPVKTAEFSFSAPEQVFTVGYKFTDIHTESDFTLSQHIGYIFAECPVSILGEICGSVNFGSGAQLYIIDSGGEAVYATDRDKERTGRMLELFAAGELRRKAEAAGNDWLLVNSPVENTGWSVLAALPYKHIISNSEKLKNSFILLCVISAVIISAITVIISFSFTQPIRLLQSKMKKVGEGELDVRISERRNDEFGDLYDGFNRLISELNQLISAAAQSEERENIAKYQMLQSQINPHFLYNSLDTVRMMAVIEDKPDIADALVHLSSLFRYNVRESNKLVTVREELEQAKNYLSLQKLRLQEKLEIVCEADEAALDLRMPKILLQPILENCFSHGFKDIDHTYIITIKITADDKKIAVSVRDNGRGMDKATLEGLRARLAGGAAPAERGIGLYNVNERLRLYFSEQCCLKIESRPEGGTQVSFKIPAMENATALYRFENSKGGGEK